jgi:serine/threonine protein kinase
MADGGGAAPPKKAVVKKKKDEISYNEIVIECVIGEGSFGKVYRALLWGQEVAVKEMRLKGNPDAAIKEFKKEVKIMRTLRHPNVVEFLGACVQSPNLCIVTEYMQKGSLEDLITKMEEKNKRFSFQRVLSLAKDICRGLNWLHHKAHYQRSQTTFSHRLHLSARRSFCTHAHSITHTHPIAHTNPLTPSPYHQAIIHRDLKTANILLDMNGRAKIADFGLSHVKRRTGDVTGGFYGVCGTPCYMAPEVLKKQPYGMKADVFSFAIVLCEMVVGKYPYENEPESTATFEQASLTHLSTPRIKYPAPIYHLDPP